MELLQLKYFETVAKYENMTAASNILCVAQPAISQSIARLEEDLGVKLFERKGKRIRLNACGKHLYDRLAMILTSLDSIKTELAEIAEQADSTIGLKVLAASALMPRLLSEFKQAYPHIGFRLAHVPSEPNYDLCLSSSASVKDGRDTVLLDEEILVAVPQRAPYRTDDIISLKELRDEGFVSLSKGLVFRDIMDEYCRAVRFVPRIVFESDSPATVRGLVRAGTGIAFWPSRSWGSLGKDPIKTLHIADFRAARVITLSAPEGKKMTKSDLYQKGVFLCLQQAALKSGDKIAVTGLSGFGFTTSTSATSFLPNVGDLLLYQPGAKVGVGYNGTIPADPQKNAADPLSGLRLLWLGSSVTYGQAAQGYAVADYLEETHQALRSYKYAVSGTTLVDDSVSSYISRMKQIPTDLHPDYLIVQLSTNDAAMNKPFGSLSAGTNLSDFDTHTIYGAMEYVIAYAAKTWNCPVVFFTGTYYDKSTYSNDGTAYTKMVNTLLDVRQKWGIQVIDLYDDDSMTALYNTEQYKKLMSDGVHPTANGYRTWWGPKFEKALTSYITAVPHTVAFSGQTVGVNGTNMTFEAYNIDGSNYFKLRDVAFVLNGTGSQFSVTYDEKTNTIACTTGQAYTKNGTEMMPRGDLSAGAAASAQSMTVNGKAVKLSAFCIGGNNYFKLRDLAVCLRFTVDYNAAAKTLQLKSA